MARVFVPVSAQSDQDPVRVLPDLVRMGASRVYMSIGERFPFERGQRRDEILSSIKEKAEFYSKNGIEAAVWIDTLGFGGGHATYNKAAAKYTTIKAICGRELPDAFCPMDKDFTDMMAQLVEDICRVTGIRMLMLDDELCLSVRPGIGCLCDKHMAEYRRRMGEDIAAEDIARLVYTGAPSRYRTEWLSLMGDTLKDFCRSMREAVDRVDPDIRLGFCTGFTSWDLEGVDAPELARILAGKNKPFLRFTGAPYWFARNRFGFQTLQTVIETARMQYAWCKDSGIEVFAEADTYPRDRYHTPAVYSECFDMGTRISDDMDVLKYVYHYPCKPDYETGYVSAHERNKPVYDEIARVFNGKKAVGIRVYESMRKLQGAHISTEIRGTGYAELHALEKRLMQQMIFSSAQAMLTSNAIPTVYDGQGICGIAFGENARYLSDRAFEKGLILDAKAAMILEEKGIDTGLASCEKESGAWIEHFEDGIGVDSELRETAVICRIKTREGAVVLSSVRTLEQFSEDSSPLAYLYENKKGQRFLVYAFDAEDQRDESSLFWSYCRGIQIANAVEWLGGEGLCVRCEGNPLLYCIVKENERSRAVAYLNCHPDPIPLYSHNFLNLIPMSAFIFP